MTKRSIGMRSAPGANSAGMAGEGMLRIVRQLLHSIAQLRHMHAQVLRRLHIRHASILDQAHSFKFELSRELPPLHDAIVRNASPSAHRRCCLRSPPLPQIEYP